MSDITQALHAHLSTHGSLAPLVATRVYPAQLPGAPTLPAVTYQRISNVALTHRSSRRPTYSRPRFQIDGWAATYGGAQQLRSAIMDAMADFTQASDPRVDVALHQDGRDILEPSPGRWRASLDYFVWAEEL